MTYPVISHLDTHVAGDGGDSLQCIWNLWWVKKALLDPKIDLYYTDYMYYPKGSSLKFHTLSLFNSILSIPFQNIFNLLVIYNILFLFHFVLAGYGMFLLVNYLINDKGIAFISGLAYTFCPFHFSHGLGHLQTMSIGWIPFYVLFLFKTSREDNKKKCHFCWPISNFNIFIIVVFYDFCSYFHSCIFFTPTYFKEKKFKMASNYNKKSIDIVNFFNYNITICISNDN
jgi:hypothetical protein